MSDGAAKIPAVVLAGGKAKPEIVAATGVENRALIPVNGRTMLEHVVSALHRAPSIGRVIVVGNVGDSPDYERVDDHGGFVENIQAGLEAAGDVACAVVATCDIPFLTGEAVEDFATRSAAAGADLVYPFVRVEACLERFPGAKRTSVPLREGRFTGGNMVLVRPEFMRTHRARLAEAYAARKSPLRLALMLGLGTTVRLAGAFACCPSLLDVPRLERAVSRLLDGQARGLMSDYPELATDIDRPGDLEALRAAEKPI